MLAAFVVVVFGNIATAGVKTEKGNLQTSTKSMPRYKYVSGNELSPNGIVVPLKPGLVTDSPGDIIGTTTYEYQSNGSSGTRVAVDNDNAVHFAWMKGDVANFRHIYYNYVPVVGGPPNYGTSGVDVSFRNRDGYNQLDLTADNRAAVAFHNASVVGAESTYLAVDLGPGSAIFDYYRPPNRWGAQYNVWPYLAVDNGGRIQVIHSESTPNAGELQRVGYTRSTDGGTTWSTLAVVDTTMTISTVVAASPVSDKVALVYTNPIFGDSTQWQNDVYYNQTLDGSTWDWRFGKINVTNYGPPDSLYAYTDVDAVYDYNDNLHIVWSAQYISDSLGIYYAAKLLTYNTGTGIITQLGCFDSTWVDTGCDFGAWNFAFAKYSISVDPLNNGAMFITYTSWNLNDCAANGFGNGDIYMHYSTDYGATWTLPGNITNSNSDSCLAGDCDSDHWSSLAEKVDDNLHLFYSNDKDAGGFVQTEGVETENPMLYLHYPNPVRNTAATTPPPLQFPYNGMEFSEGYAQFEWGDPIGVDDYTIEIDTDNQFNPPMETFTGFCRSQYINTDSFEIGTYYWRVIADGVYGANQTSEVWTFGVIQGGPTCVFVNGDANGNGTTNGLDVTYLVNYLKGGPNPPPIQCDCPTPLYPGADANGNCAVNGLDVTYLVNFLKGGPNAPLGCVNCL